MTADFGYWNLQLSQNFVDKLGATICALKRCMINLFQKHKYL